jgi:hypothetical protein
LNITLANATDLARQVQAQGWTAPEIAALLAEAQQIDTTEHPAARYAFVQRALRARTAPAKGGSQ